MKKILVGILFLMGSFSILPSNAQSKPITPETALQAYLHNNDNSFTWEIKDKLKSEGLTFYRVQYVSQTWQGIKWTHDLMIMVPDELQFNNALLFITGGSNHDGEPNTHTYTEDLPQAFGKMAITNKTLIALLWQVPNQPLYDGLTEDALISRTLHNYQNDHNFSWPLLFPMTKSAVRAMDLVQQFSKKEVHKKIKGFVVSGASKRGWTSWLTGANDPRVVAIGPMVIDMLNMSVNIEYQKKVWGDYSVEIEDYVKLGIAQQLGNKEGSDLIKMVDPYSYRKTLTMPKMIFMGTNDPYWPVDAVKNYIDSIPGDNHLCYIPNAGHGMGDKKQALTTLSAFLGNVVTKSKLPVCSYKLTKGNGKVTLSLTSTPDLLVGAYLWTASSPDQDFRNDVWNSVDLNAAKKPSFQVDVDLPASGFKAFYIDLKYKAPFGNDFIQSTRIFVLTDKQVLLKEN
jgi:PhoPQ-activated pathogenicity-related protein